MGVKDVYVQRPSKVLLVIEDDGKRDYGLTVYTEDDLGNRFIFAHLDWVSCKAGQVLEPWTPFAEMGATGHCPSGAHLHYGMFLPGESLGDLRAANAIDPTTYVKLYGQPCGTILTNPFGSKVRNKKLNGHEGLDFSSWRVLT